MNPIDRKNVYTNLHFNSKYRKGYFTSSSSDFHYNLPKKIDNVKSLKLSSICIPNSWYTFLNDQTSNKFTIELSGGIIPFASFNITIPDGNYTATELTKYLNDTHFHNSGTTTALKYVKITISNFNLKTIIALVSPPAYLKMKLKFIDNTTDIVMYTAGWTLGFRYGTYNNISSFVISEGLYDNGGDRYLYFALEDFNKNTNNTHVVMFDGSIMRNNNVLAKIYLNNDKFSINVDNTQEALGNHVKTRRYFGPVDLSKIHVKILDQYGRIINLNSMDFSFSLEVEQVYK